MQVGPVAPILLVVECSDETGPTVLSSPRWSEVLNRRAYLFRAVFNEAQNVLRRRQRRLLSLSPAIVSPCGWRRGLSDREWAHTGEQEPLDEIAKSGAWPTFEVLSVLGSEPDPEAFIAQLADGVDNQVSRTARVYSNGCSDH